MPNKEFKHESLQDPRSVGKYLKVLMEGIESGHLSFNQDGQDIMFSPQGVIHIDVKAKKKDGKAKLSLKFSWRERDEDKKDPKMTINSTE